MADPLCDLSGGELRSAPLAAILVEALRARATGELRVDANGGTSRVYFRGGQPCGAQIFFGFKPLGQFLLELGWIDIEALERSLSAVAEGRKQGEALVELGFLTSEKLHLGLALHHQRHIKTLANVADGTYAFSPQVTVPAWTSDLKLSAHRAILDSFAVPHARALGERILQRLPTGQGLRLRSGWERFSGHFQFDAAEQVFLGAATMPRALEELVRAGDLPEERARALTAVLFLMGVLVPAPVGAPLQATPGPLFTPGPSWIPTPGPEVVRGLEHSAGPQQARGLERSAGPRGLSSPVELTEPFDQKVGVSTAAAAMAATAVGTAVEIDFGDPVEPPQPRPPAVFKSDADAARERRTRLLHRAFGSILGEGDPLRRVGSTPGPGATRTPGPPAVAPRELIAPEDPRFPAHVDQRSTEIREEDHFVRLGVPRTATRDQIKQAFFSAAKIYHPDRLPSAVAHLAPKLKEIFSAINESYQLLQDDERRVAYLRELEREQSGGPDAGHSEQIRVLEVRGLQALKRKNWVEARQIFRDALRLEDRPALRAHLAWIEHSDPKSANAFAARGDLELLVADHPDCGPAHYYLGLLARLAGNSARAEELFRGALHVDPDHAEARQELRLLELRKASARKA